LSTGAAKAFDPSRENLVVGRFEIEELRAKADAWLDDADDDESVKDLTLAGEAQTGTRVRGKRLAGANEAATHRYVGSHTNDLRSGIHVNQFGISGEGIADRIAAVAQAANLRRGG